MPIKLYAAADMDGMDENVQKYTSLYGIASKEAHQFLLKNRTGIVSVKANEGVSIGKGKITVTCNLTYNSDTRVADANAVYHSTSKK